MDIIAWHGLGLSITAREFVWVIQQALALFSVTVIIIVIRLATGSLRGPYRCESFLYAKRE